SYDASDATIIAYLHEQASAAMKQTYQILDHRINQFGVAQPNINLDEAHGIISVELAGASDPDRVLKYLQSTANLQCWEVYNIDELGQSLVNADKSLQDFLNGVKHDTTAGTKADSTKKDTSQLAANKNPLLQNRHIQFIPAQTDQKTGKRRY